MANPYGIAVPGYVFPHAIDLYSMRDAADDGGGRVPSPLLLAKQLPCLVQPATPEEQDEVLARTGQQVSHSVHTPADVKGLGLKVGDRLDFGGRLFDVRAVTDHSEMGVLRTVYGYERSPQPSAT